MTITTFTSLQFVPIHPFPWARSLQILWTFTKTLKDDYPITTLHCVDLQKFCQKTSNLIFYQDF